MSVNSSTTDAILASRRFNHLDEPPPVHAVYSLAGIPIATPGNLVAVASAVKTGKSAVIGAMLASTMSTDGSADLLGFDSGNPKELAVLHFDSEQSRGDHWHCVDRALRRAGMTEPPAWLHSYCLAGLGCKQAWECVKLAIQIATEKHGGVHSVLIDGIADFVVDVNEAAVCNSFVTELHDLAIEYDCPVVGVIHFNPGSDKTRGHLGSQFERKAETNLRLDKDADGITTIWSEKQRRAPITKAGGPCFWWDDSAGMHVGVQNPSEAKASSKAEAKTTAARQEADTVFAQGGEPLRHKDLIQKMTDSLDMSEVGAKKKLRKWVGTGIVAKDEGSGLYSLAQLP